MRAPANAIGREKAAKELRRARRRSSSRRRSSGDDEIAGGLEIARTPCDGEDASAAVGSLALTTL